MLPGAGAGGGGEAESLIAWLLTSLTLTPLTPSSPVSAVSHSGSCISGITVADTVKETVQALVLFRGQQRLTLLEHVPGRGHVRVDGAQVAGLVGETDQVVVDMLPGGAVTSQGLVEGPQHLHGHQSHLSVVGHRQLLTKCQGQCLRLT